MTHDTAIMPEHMDYVHDLIDAPSMFNYGLSKIAMLCKNGVRWKHIRGMVDSANIYGKRLAPVTRLFDSEELCAINTLLSSEPSDPYSLVDGMCDMITWMSSVSELVCTDFSLTIPYAKEVPIVNVNYMYSLFITNFIPVQLSTEYRAEVIRFGLQLYTILVSLLGVNYDRFKYDITISKTHHDEILIIYKSPEGKKEIELYDMTICALLSPNLISEDAVCVIERSADVLR